MLRSVLDTLIDIALYSSPMPSNLRMLCIDTILMPLVLRSGSVITSSSSSCLCWSMSLALYPAQAEVQSHQSLHLELVMVTQCPHRSVLAAQHPAQSPQWLVQSPVLATQSVLLAVDFRPLN